jgi:type IV pilus assembly protein PilA
MQLPRDLNKYPELLPELGTLFEKIQRGVEFPPPRSQSRLLPLLPDSTVFYAAFPNYAGVAQQALQVFRRERQESAVLRDWWQHGEVAASGPKVEEAIEKFYEFSQYLGDEIVVSGTANGTTPPNILIIAEVRKPGLKTFLQQTMPTDGKPAIRVLDQRELTAAKDSTNQQLMVLVRPDFIVGASNVATLRSFNSRLNRKDSEFASSPFGQRLQRAYQGGTSVLAGADLHKIVSQIPLSPEQGQIFQRTGFADLKYAIWEHKGATGQSASQAELSFTRPRHGVASWLGAPRELGSLDFVSPKALVAGTVALKNLALIFDDLKDLATASNPSAFAMIDQMQQGLGVNLKDDLLKRLSGEITLELDNPSLPDPIWKAIIRVDDPAGLQQTFTKLMAMAPVPPQHFDEGDLTYHVIQVPSSNKAVEIAYAFVDGYMVIGSSKKVVAEAARIHRSGESLAKSKRFLASLPPGYSSEASAILYEDPIAMAALKMGQLSPELGASFSQLSGGTSPAVIAAYAYESTIREASASNGLDAGVVLVGAAIAIPNLLRAKISANEASAVGTVRNLVIAQVAYSATYPEKGYARDLATLGADPRGTNAVTADHAGFLESTLGNSSCTVGKWCVKSGYRFTFTFVCQKPTCEEFVAIGTPISNNTGSRSFCSTSDGVIRYTTAPPLTSPVDVSECQRWPPLH